MRWLCVFAASAASLFAQLPAPNESGVSTGHHHLMVRDPEAHKKLWIGVLGAEVVTAGNLEMLKLPGIFILVGKAEPSGGSNGSSVNHIGFLMKDYADLKAKLTAANVPMVVDSAADKQMIVTFPDDIRVEFNEDASLKVPITHHHIHLQVTDPEAVRAWYVKTFGATAGSRRNSPAAMMPGGEVDFLKANQAQAPTKGRALDHIGFEVKGLEAFCKKLAAEGTTFDVPFRDVPQIGLKIAFIIDPVGTRIELTEGLAGR